MSEIVLRIFVTEVTEMTDERERERETPSMAGTETLKTQAQTFRHHNTLSIRTLQGSRQPCAVPGRWWETGLAAFLHRY